MDEVWREFEEDGTRRREEYRVALNRLLGDPDVFNPAVDRPEDFL